MTEPAHTTKPGSDLELDTDGLCPAEIAAIRQAIDEELADHLACLADDHAIAGGSADTAREAVLDQFGDPDAMARKLFWDATKGRLLMQRITLGTAAASLLVSLATIGLLMFVLGRLSGLDRTLDRTDAAVADVAASLDRIAERMDAEPSLPVASPADPTYQTARIRLLHHDRTPIANTELTLKPTIETASAGGVPLKQVTDADGIANFPAVHIGAYFLQESGTAELKERYTDGREDLWPFIVFSHEKTGAIDNELLVQPGQSIDATVVYPDENFDVRPLRITVDRFPAISANRKWRDVGRDDYEEVASFGSRRESKAPPFQRRIGWYFEIEGSFKTHEGTVSDPALPNILATIRSRPLQNQKFWLTSEGTLHDASSLYGRSQRSSWRDGLPLIEAETLPLCADSLTIRNLHLVREIATDVGGVDYQRYGVFERTMDAEAIGRLLDLEVASKEPLPAEHGPILTVAGLFDGAPGTPATLAFDWTGPNDGEDASDNEDQP